MSTATVQIAPGTYSVEPIHSNVEFGVKHMAVATFRGGFADFDAALVVSEDGSAKLTGSAQVASVQVKEENLAGHLQSPEFFDAQLHPRIEFRAEHVNLPVDGEVSLEGELTIKGVTQTVELRGQVSYVESDISGNPRVGLDLETTVDRTAYGLNWNAPLAGGGLVLSNKVKLAANLELVPAAE